MRRLSVADERWLVRNTRVSARPAYDADSKRPWDCVQDEFFSSVQLTIETKGDWTTVEVPNLQLARLYV